MVKINKITINYFKIILTPKRNYGKQIVANFDKNLDKSKYFKIENI